MKVYYIAGTTPEPPPPNPSVPTPIPPTVPPTGVPPTSTPTTPPTTPPVTPSQPSNNGTAPPSAPPPDEVTPPSPPPEAPPVVPPSPPTDEFPDIPYDPNAGGILDTVEAVGGKIMLYHGWVLWAAWGCIGFLQLLLCRYYKIFNVSINLKLIIHIVTGVAMLVMTTTMAILAIKYYEWDLRLGESKHAVMGLIVLVATYLVFVLGLFSLGSNKVIDNRFFEIVRLLQIKGAHKLLGYVLLVFSQVTILLGIVSYNATTGGSPILGTINLITFFLIWVVFEISYRYKYRIDDTIIKELPTINVNEFNSRLLQGEKLVVLEDLVLDVRDYMDKHPGGRFLLAEVIGRDVSKYFYGGYTYGKASYLHQHSDEAQKMTLRLAIAKLNYTGHGAPEFDAYIAEKEDLVKNSIYRMTFEIDEKITGVQRFYNDVDYFGRHYAIYHSKNPDKKRQYSIAFGKLTSENRSQNSKLSTPRFLTISWRPRHNSLPTVLLTFGKDVNSTSLKLFRSITLPRPFLR